MSVDATAFDNAAHPSSLCHNLYSVRRPPYPVHFMLGWDPRCAAHQVAAVRGRGGQRGDESADYVRGEQGGHMIVPRSREFRH